MQCLTPLVELGLECQQFIILGQGNEVCSAGRIVEFRRHLQWPPRPAMALDVESKIVNERRFVWVESTKGCRGLHFALRRLRCPARTMLSIVAAISRSAASA